MDADDAKLWLQLARRELLTRLLAHCMVESDPERITAIMHSINQVLNRGRERYANK